MQSQATVLTSVMSKPEARIQKSLFAGPISFVSCVFVFFLCVFIFRGCFAALMALRTQRDMAQSPAATAMLGIFIIFIYCFLLVCFLSSFQ